MGASTYPRIYQTILEEHLSKYRQMVFLSGPRQVGKTTVARSASAEYLNWDDASVKRMVMSGPAAVATHCGLDELTSQVPIVVFDEIHKFGKWKSFLKSFFDLYEGKTRVIATGSAKMDVYKRGGDSMMGRYFPYRMHPFSVAELLTTSLPGEELIRPPKPLDDGEWNALQTYGGFPEPFVTRDSRFSRRWNKLRFDQLTQEDIRNLTKVTELDQMAALAEILMHRSGEQLVYKNLGAEVGIDEKTAKKWVKTLRQLYFGFKVRPWFKNIENAIRKTPKWFLRDWAQIEDPGKRAETMVACHLLKAVDCWTDLGFGEFSLGYLRNTRKEEVDFVVTRDNSPWFLVEVKKSDQKLSEALADYQRQSGAKFAFQVVLDMPYVDRSCFEINTPVVVPARTFLSQLV